MRILVVILAGVLAGCATVSPGQKYLNDLGKRCEADPTMRAPEYEHNWNYQNSTHPRCAAVIERAMEHQAIAERRAVQEYPPIEPAQVYIIRP